MAKSDLISTLQILKSRCAMPTEGLACDVADRSKCWMRHDHSAARPIGAEEMISLKALIAYVAHETNRNEFRVERDFSDSFCVPSLKCLPASQYDQAIRYLAEQVPLKAASH